MGKSSSLSLAFKKPGMPKELRWSLLQKKKQLLARKSKVTSEPCGQWSMKLSSFKRTLRSRWEALTDDFIEDMLLQSKPLQGVLSAIRNRQRVKLAEIKKEYDALIEPLEALYIKRPPKPAPAPPKPAEEAKPAEPAPAAVEAPAPAAVTA